MSTSTRLRRWVPNLLADTVFLLMTGSGSTLFGQIALYDNLSDIPFSLPTGAPPFTQMAERFSTDSSSTLLTDITLKLKQISTIGTYTVSLYSDNGAPGNSSAPSVLLDSVATGDLSTVPASYTDTHFSGLSLAVSPNTRYWLVLSTDSTAHTVDWPYSHNSQSGTAWSSFSSGTWSTTADGSAPMEMQVLAAVPEPGSYAWTASLGLLGFAVGRRLASGKFR